MGGIAAQAKHLLNGHFHGLGERVEGGVVRQACNDHPATDLGPALFELPGLLVGHCGVAGLVFHGGRVVWSRLQILQSFVWWEKALSVGMSGTGRLMLEMVGKEPLSMLP